MRASQFAAAATTAPRARFACLAAVTCLCSGVLTGTGRAGFVGQSVQVVDAAPTVTTILVNLGTQTIVAGGTAFTGGTFGENVTVSDTSFQINFPSNSSFNSAAFNGFVVSEVGTSPDTITGASLGTTNASGFHSSMITFDAKDVFVNFAGVSVPDNGELSVNVTFAAATAPEPASLTLLGLGVAGIAGYAWRRRR
jgi:hypothetical protein